MEKIRIAHLVVRPNPLGHSRTAIDILNRCDPQKYQFLLLSGRRPESGLISTAQIPVLTFSELAKARSFWASLKLIADLTQALREWRPEVLHIHSLKVGTVGAIAGKLAGVPSIIYSSEGFTSSLKRKRRSFDLHPWDRDWIMGMIPAFLSKVIVTATPHDLEEETAYGFARRSKYRVIYHAIQPERMASAHSESPEVLKYRMGLDVYYPILGTAARLDREKGIEFLIEAVAQLKNRFPEIVLLIIGDGPLRENLLVLAKQLNIMNHVRFLGLRDDVPDLLRLLDIFVLPSLYEATGIVLAEAMAFGKPIVSTQVGGLPELVHHGEDGFLVPPGDVARLVEKIARLARDQELAHRMGERAAQKARQIFDMSKMLADYEGIYQTLANKKRKGSRP